MMRTEFFSPETESALGSYEQHKESSKSVKAGEILARWTALEFCAMMFVTVEYYKILETFRTRNIPPTENFIKPDTKTGEKVHTSKCMLDWGYGQHRDPSKFGSGVRSYRHADEPKIWAMSSVSS
jgi:hypothetical protein